MGAGPPGCLQYHTGKVGHIASFAFPITASLTGTTKIASTATHLNNQGNLYFRGESLKFLYYNPPRFEGCVWPDEEFRQCFFKYWLFCLWRKLKKMTQICNPIFWYRYIELHKVKEVQYKIDSRRLPARATKVQLIGQKLSFNLSPIHVWTFMSCNSNEVQEE